MGIVNLYFKKNSMQTLILLLKLNALKIDQLLIFLLNEIKGKLIFF